MASYADRVHETTTTAGTGTYSLEGAVAGLRTFIDGVGTGATVTYTVENGADWEIGQGVVTTGSPATLTRASILKSSNSNSAVNWSAGSKNVYLVASAERLVINDKDNTLNGRTFIPDGSLTSPSIAFGTDTDVGLYRAGSNSMAVSIGTGSTVPPLQVSGQNNGSTGVEIAGSNSGNPEIRAKGAATNIDLLMSAKGTGSIQLSSSGRGDIAGFNSSSDSTTQLDFWSFNGYTETYYENKNPALNNVAYHITSGTATNSQHIFQTYNGTNYYEMLLVAPQAAITGAQNFACIYSGNPGTPVLIQPWGGDSAISMRFNAIGTGSLLFNGTTTTISSTGKVNTTASASGSAGLNIPHGTAPSSPVNGDLWTTSADMFYRINGTTLAVARTASPTFTGTTTTSNLTINGTFTSTGSGANEISGSGALTISTTGAVSVTNSIVQSTRGFSSAEYSAGTGAPGTINWNNGQNQTKTLTSSGSLTLSNPTNGATYKLRIVQGGAGNFTIAWPAIKWSGGVAPTLGTAVGSEDIVTLYYNGTSYYGQFAGGFA